ncbi:hypothetical protein B296_00043750 [Ensete ventricosum]|uniref:Uncharacterized protein n=1 Tax=Ensete ventricosum TaxID=4639 RepID=A0A426ZDI3_ENSVE|nr:hypothetical protein B296_00043750 [Ensete ventricosum]
MDSFYNIEKDLEARDDQKPRSDRSRLRSWREENSGVEIGGARSRSCWPSRRATRWKIAKLTTNYVMLLRIFLAVFVDNRDLLERIVKLMCIATVESSKAWACTCRRGGGGSMCKQNGSAPTGGPPATRLQRRVSFGLRERRQGCNGLVLVVESYAW